MQRWFRSDLHRQILASRSRRRKSDVRRLFTEPLETRVLLATVTSVNPLENSFDAPVSTDVSATFDENINAASATSDNFVVHRSEGPLATTVTATDMTVTADPAQNFKPGEVVQVTSTQGIQGTTAGVPKVWQFRAAVSSGSGELTDTGQAIGGVSTLNGNTGSLGDLDGDGDLDLFVGGNGANGLYFNDGAGGFTNSGQNVDGGNSIDADMGDLDGDGDLDLVVANNNQANVVWLNDGNGTLTQGSTLTSNSTEAVELGDFDGDGDLDVFLGNRGPGNRVFLNNGNGTFVDSGQVMGNSQSSEVEIGDVDGDGDLDAVVGNYYQPNRIWFNDGTGVFTDSGQAIAFNRASGLGLGDMDGDGDLDYVEANISGGFGSKLYLNAGNGVFTDSGQQIGGNRNSFSIAIGDIDGDSDLDFVVGNNQTNGIYLNDGTGVISTPVLNFTCPAGPGAAGCFDPGSTRRTPLGDIDGDGDLDIVSVNTQFGNPPGTRVWLNRNLTPSVSLSIDNATIAEDSGTATVTATLSQAHTDPVTVDLATTGTASAEDYTLSGTQIVIAAGATSGAVTITAVQDAVDEPDETVIVDISAVTNGQGAGAQQVTTTILDDDEPIPVPDVTLSVDNAAIAEAAGVATFTANLSVPTTVPVTIDFAVSGTADASDYTVSATQIVVAAGATSGSITVNATQDEVDEPDETVIVDISNVTGGAESGTQQATTTITDDDEPVMPDVTLAVDQASIAEAAGVAVFTVTLSEVTTAPVTVDVGLTGTADASDYTVSATQVVIAAGATSETVTVTAVQDEVNEPDETVIVDITNVAGGNEAGDQQATTTIVDDDTPPSFRVTSLTATDSGFVIEFNSQLDGSALNMYDTQNAGLGAADVSVSGATSGNVVGSLVIGTNSVEFIKSGDSLGADTYTVTLRSADDGFKDDGGALLDGDGDGAAGGDYSNSFTVDAAPEGARTVSIPDFVRGPGQDVNLPADGTTGIPISISDGTNVRAADIRISYDPALLQITGATAPAGGTVVVNTTTPGLAILVYFATTALPAGPSDFINLQATVPTENASANYRSQQVLDVHDVIIGDGNDNEFPAVVDDAFHLNTYFADVSGNGRINASDAAQVARFAALIDSGFAASLNADPIIVGDISGNGRINAADASRVAQFAALIPVPEIPPVPGGILINGVFGPVAQDIDRDDSSSATAPAEASVGFREYPDTFGIAAVANHVEGDRDIDEAVSTLDELLNDPILDDGLLDQLATHRTRLNG